MFTLSFFEKHLWLVKITIGVIFLIVFQIILSYSLKLIKKKAEKNKKTESKDIYKLFYTPINLLIWIFVIAFILSVIAFEFDLPNFSVYVTKIRNLAIVLDLLWLMFKWKKKIQQRIILRKQKYIDKHSIEFIGKIVSITILFITILIVLQLIGLNIMPLMAFSSIGAATIGFAAKDIIANFFGGLMLYMNRPFVKGDLIEVPSQDILGTVENIGWYSTCIKELQKIPIYVPNNIFSNSLIKNKSRRSHRRMEETIKIRYDDFAKVQLIVDEIKDYIIKNNHFDPSLDQYVFFDNFSDFSLDILVKAYTTVTSQKEFYELRHNFLLKVQNIVVKHKAKMPYPIQSVELLNQNNR
jgi:MscS family membrane protein